MAGVLLGAVLIVVAAGYWLARAHRRLASSWFLGVAWRFVSGVSAGDRMSRPRLAVWRSGGVLGVLALVVAWIESPQVTLYVLAVLAISGLVLSIVLSVRWVRQFRHGRTWLRPLHLAACDVAMIPRGRPPGSWLEVAPDRQHAALALPPGWPADDKDKQRLVAIVTAKIGIESPEVSWRLAGPRPTLELTASQPPPVRVSVADIRPAIDAARPDELIWGLGKRASVIKSSLSSDSPHIGLSMGSGAGKSVTARALLAQMLYRGCVGLILDYKMISHQWARRLPNVAIARRPHEIHEALLWLGREAIRRNEVALAGADDDGNVHAVVGARLIIVCEELNATMGTLRAYWRQLRNEDRSLPQRSPALEALDSVNLMGRQVLMNLVYMGQRLSVKAIGGDGDARESIGVVALGRYKPAAWKMLAGDFPMPPTAVAPGRIQVVSDRVREVQGVYMSAREAQELALAGTVAACPAGMPGAVAVPAETREQIPGPDQANVLGTGASVLTLPGQLVTLKEAVDEAIVSRSLHALRKASQRDPDFPRRAGLRGVAGEYDPLALAEWDASSR